MSGGGWAGARAWADGGRWWLRRQYRHSGRVIGLAVRRRFVSRAWKKRGRFFQGLENWAGVFSKVWNNPPRLLAGEAPSRVTGRRLACQAGE